MESETISPVRLSHTKIQRPGAKSAVTLGQALYRRETTMPSVTSTQTVTATYDTAPSATPQVRAPCVSGLTGVVFLHDDPAILDLARQVVCQRLRRSQVAAPFSTSKAGIRYLPAPSRAPSSLGMSGSGDVVVASNGAFASPFQHDSGDDELRLRHGRPPTTAEVPTMSRDTCQLCRETRHCTCHAGQSQFLTGPWLLGPSRIPQWYAADNPYADD